MIHQGPLETQSEKAILLVAFGTAVSGADRSFLAIETRVREKYPGIRIGWAFTSKSIREKAAARGRDLPSPETALVRLMNGGSIHVAVLSLHIVPGEEFQNLCRDVEKIQSENGRLRKVEIARPLLGNAEDMKTVCEILVGRFPRKGPYEGVIFVGHGNLRHPSDAIYSHMNSFLAARRSGFFVGTVQGRPTPDELLPELKAAGITKVLLVPLMTLAGEHARKDMAGDGPESWKSVLDANGIESEPVFTGLAEDQDVVGVWLNHLEEAFSTL